MSKKKIKDLQEHIKNLQALRNIDHLQRQRNELEIKQLKENNSTFKANQKSLIEGLQNQYKNNIRLLENLIKAQDDLKVYRQQYIETAKERIVNLEEYKGENNEYALAK